MFVLRSKKNYNDQLDKYTSSLNEIQNLLVSDEIDLNSKFSFKSSKNLLNYFSDKKLASKNDNSFWISSIIKRSDEYRLRSEVVRLEAEIAVLQDCKNGKSHSNSVVDDFKALYRQIKSVFKKENETEDKRELQDRLRKLKEDWREALERLQSKLTKQKNHLQKERSLYNLLIDQRKGLRRVVRNVINSSLDEEEDAYLINHSVLSHLKIKLNKNFFNITSNEFQNKNYRCYTAYT